MSVLKCHLTLVSKKSFFKLKIYLIYMHLWNLFCTIYKTIRQENSGEKIDQSIVINDRCNNDHSNIFLIMKCSDIYYINLLTDDLATDLKLNIFRYKNVFMKCFMSRRFCEVSKPVRYLICHGKKWRYKSTKCLLAKQ